MPNRFVYFVCLEIKIDKSLPLTSFFPFGICSGSEFDSDSESDESELELLVSLDSFLSSSGDETLPPLDLVAISCLSF